MIKNKLNSISSNHSLFLAITIMLALLGTIAFSVYNTYQEQYTQAARGTSKAKKSKSKKGSKKQVDKPEKDSMEDGYKDGSGIILPSESTDNLRLAPSQRMKAKQVYTMATYNILQAESHPKKSRFIGKCPKGTPGDPICANSRSDRQAKIIKGEAGNAVFDVVGTQETSPTQYDILKSKLPNYGVYPDYESNKQRIKTENGGNVIWWDKSKFSLRDKGTYQGYNNRGKKADIPWVALQANNGNTFYFSSVHYATRKNGGTPSKMKLSSQKTVQWARGKRLVILVGDFNDRTDRDNTYCILTNSTGLQNTFDSKMGHSPATKCPSKSNYRGIDHIYASAGSTSTLEWGRLPSTGIYQEASDHTPVYAKIEM